MASPDAKFEGRKERSQALRRHMTRPRLTRITVALEC